MELRTKPDQEYRFFVKEKEYMLFFSSAAAATQYMKSLIEDYEDEGSYLEGVTHLMAGEIFAVPKSFGEDGYRPHFLGEGFTQSSTACA